MTLIIETLETETMLLFTDFSFLLGEIPGWMVWKYFAFYFFDAFNYFVPKCCTQKTLHSWYSCGKAKTSISQNADIPKFRGAKSEAV